MRISFLFPIAAALAFVAVFPAATTTTARAENARDVHRFPYGETRLAPAWMMKRPDGYEFSPMVSNHDPLHQHPPAWAGQWEEQDWDPATWPQERTVENVLTGFQRAGILGQISIDQPALRTVELGPRFYTLSRRDQDRILKLATDHAGSFNNSANPILLRDHHTGKTVGSYGMRGLHMF